MERAVILEGARSPIGRFLGALSEVSAVDLGVHATAAALRRAGVEPTTVDELYFGHARQAGNGPNPARQVAYRSGLGEETPGITVNMACGSGAKATQIAAEQIMLGNAEVVVAGGQESMSRTPYLLDRMRTGYRGVGDPAAQQGGLAAAAAKRRQRGGVRQVPDALPGPKHRRGGGLAVDRGQVQGPPGLVAPVTLSRPR